MKGSTTSYLKNFLINAPEEMSDEVLSYLTKEEYLKLRRSSRSFCKPQVSTSYGEDFRRIAAKYTFPTSRAENPWLFPIVSGELSLPAMLISIPLQLSAKLIGSVIDLGFFCKRQCRNYTSPPLILKQPNEVRYFIK